MGRRERGSIQSFIVVGIVLFIISGGLLYAVGHMDSGDTGQIATDGSKDKPGQSDDGVTFPEIQTEGDNATDNGADEQSDTQSDTTPTTDTGTGETGGESDSAETDALPQSGPADTLLSIVSFGSLMTASYFYIDARRARR